MGKVISSRCRIQPGNTDLITLKGLKAIQQADVILYDRLVNKDLLEYAKSDADIILTAESFRTTIPSSKKQLTIF